ncbi:MAG: hypothetical protein PHV93_03510 [Candidatus Pacebacteria bacterium]|nr:hypothetical protein [Candidatus Paceibacterota bacterium]
MNQLKAPQVIGICWEEYGKIACGFFRYGAEGQIYFASTRGGQGTTYCFPVFEDKTISTHGDITSPRLQVEMVRPEELGIPTDPIRWNELVPQDLSPLP